MLQKRTNGQDTSHLLAKDPQLVRHRAARWDSGEERRGGAGEKAALSAVPCGGREMGSCPGDGHRVAQHSPPRAEPQSSPPTAKDTACVPHPQDFTPQRSSLQASA